MCTLNRFELYPANCYTLQSYNEKKKSVISNALVKMNCCRYHPSRVRCIITHSELTKFQRASARKLGRHIQLFINISVCFSLHIQKNWEERNSDSYQRHIAQQQNKAFIPWHKFPSHSWWLEGPRSLLPASPLSSLKPAACCVKNRLYARLRKYSHIN